MAPLSESEMKLLVLALESAKVPLQVSVHILGQTKRLYLALHHVSDTDSQVDYAVLAKKSGYASKNSATVMWLRLKKKIEANAGGATTATPTKASASTITTPSSKRGRSTKATFGDDDDDNEAQEPTPTKRAKTPKSTKTDKKALETCKAEDNNSEEPGSLAQDAKVKIKNEPEHY